MLSSAQSSAVIEPDLYSRACPSRSVLEHLTSRWGVLVLTALRDGSQRFSALRRRIDGVSEKMLSQTLRTLERDGLVVRRALVARSPHVEYRLTVRGASAAALLGQLVAWIEQETPNVLEDRRAADAVRNAEAAARPNERAVTRA